jgi:OCT family organic cation transporter-like MFS transporter 4/5
VKYSSATFLIVYVQTVELYPTCIRNTGMGFTSLLGMIIGIAGPYVIHLGTIDVRYPYGIMGIITLCGAISVSIP